jgi:hypothetical protein
MAENADNSDKWTCERFIAFLDIMGFKNKLLIDGHDNVKKILMTLRQIIKPIEEIGEINKLKQKMQNVDSRISSGAFPIFFSDSFILISSDKSFGSLIILLRYIEYVFREAIPKGNSDERSHSIWKNDCRCRQLFIFWSTPNRCI